jgi:hypothetical protein
MSIFIGEIYDAFLSAGVPEDKARKAAAVLTNYDDRFTKIETDLAIFRAEVRGEFTLMKWMLGSVLAIGITLILKAFT